MIVQFAGEQLLGLLLVAEAKHRNTSDTQPKVPKRPIPSEKSKINSDRSPQSFFKVATPHF